MIEYHTVHLPTPMPPKPLSNTYREKLIARFGRVPSYQELARLEQGQPPTMRQYVPPPSMTPATTAARARIIAKGEATRIEVMRVLTEAMTCPAIAEALNRTRQLINRHLVILKAEGKVTLRKVKGVNVWEAAE
jgi:hypothetical protein